MRKIYLCFAAIGSMAIMGGIAACSSDDSTGGGGGTDSGTADTYVPPQDSGAKDSGTKDSGPGACSYCGSFLNGTGDLGNPCTGSLDKALAVVSCACNHNPVTGAAGEGLCDIDSGTGDGGGACSAFCASPTTVVPDGTCQGCAADNCTASLGACLADGQDGGTADAGDGGDGG